MSYANELTQKLIDQFGIKKAQIIINEMQKEINKRNTSTVFTSRNETIIKWI